MRSRLIAIAIVTIYAGGYHAQTIEAKIESYMEEAIEQWSIPGCAIAIVKDGKDVLSKGFGVRNSAKPAKANMNTLFAIASNTKAFTTAALMLLEERKEISLQDKVVRYLPYFQLYDDCVTQSFTIEDLICHRSGLETFSGDLLWYGSSLTREEVIEGAADLEPVRGFRTGYGYQNIMFMAAGEVIEVVTGMPWDTFIRQEFLDPLEMDATICSISDLSKSKNYASPHNEIEGQSVAIDWVNWDNMGPAGSLISNANDLSKWMKLQLGKGTLNGKQFWTEESSNKMWTIHTPKSLSGWHRNNFPSKHFAGYGLGWDLFDYHGRMIVNHGGGYDGFISQTILVPEENLGFVILTNSNSYFPYAMMYHILDLYLAPDSAKDWGAYMLDLKLKGDARQEDEATALKESRIVGTNPSLALERYQGVFNDPKYGDVRITLKDGGLMLNMEPTPLFHGTLEHWHYDTFKLIWTEDHMLPDGMVTFRLDKKGKLSEMEISCPNPDLYFYELDLKRVEE